MNTKKSISVLHVLFAASPFARFVLDVFSLPYVKNDVISYVSTPHPPHTARYWSLFRPIGVRGWAKLIFTIAVYSIRSAARNYDLVLVNYVSPIAFPIILLHRIFGRCVCCVVWGSDLNARRRISRFLFRLMVNISSRVVFLNARSLDFAVHHLGVSRQKCSVTKIGLPVLAEMRTLAIAHTFSTLRAKCKVKFNLPTGKATIFVGTYARHQQKHRYILEQLRTAQLYNAHIVLHFPYGDLDYAQDVADFSRDAFGADGVTILTDYLDKTQLAYLRYAADILVHIPQNDQFSGAMCEHLYGGAIVVAGSWLPYDELRDMDAPIIDIAKDDEVGPAVIAGMSALSPSLGEAAFRDRLFELMSEEGTRHRWRGLFGL